MHLTAPDTTCSIFVLWKSTRKRFGSLKANLPRWNYAVKFCTNCGGPRVLSVHNVGSMGDGWQRVDG
jgi:hypothetical protein